jgi:hypothetical protein
MFIFLFDRIDRLGANIITYLSQILYCHKNQFIIKYRNNSKEDYRYFNSIFVKALFQYIDQQNETFYKMNITDTEEFVFDNQYDFPRTTSFTIGSLQQDMISYYNDFLYDSIQPFFLSYVGDSQYQYSIPFDVNKTILVHLRLGDVAHRNDYDGSICSQFYKQKIQNGEYCSNQYEFYGVCNEQSPLSKPKLENILKIAQQEYPDYKVLLLTSPDSDTSFLDYDVIRNQDENLDLYLLSMCKVTVLSRSTYALTSMFFNKEKDRTYIPLWGHFVCCGLNTQYEKTDVSKYLYFY